MKENAQNLLADLGISGLIIRKVNFLTSMCATDHHMSLMYLFYSPLDVSLNDK